MLKHWGRHFFMILPALPSTTHATCSGQNKKDLRKTSPRLKYLSIEISHIAAAYAIHSIQRTQDSNVQRAWCPAEKERCHSSRWLGYRCDDLNAGTMTWRHKYDITTITYAGALTWADERQDHWLIDKSSSLLAWLADRSTYSEGSRCPVVGFSPILLVLTLHIWPLFKEASLQISQTFVYGISWEDSDWRFWGPKYL